MFEILRPALESTGTLLHLCLTPTTNSSSRRVPQDASQQATTSILLSGMGTAKELVHFLKFSVDALRDEIGVDTLCAITVALCGVIKNYLLHGLLRRTCAPSASLLTLLVSIFTLFAVTIDHPSKKFRKVLPHVLAAVSDFDQALFTPTSPVRQVLMSSAAGQSGLDDVMTIRFRLFRCCLLQHWSFFMGNPKKSLMGDPNGQLFYESSMTELLRTFEVATTFVSSGSLIYIGALAS